MTGPQQPGDWHLHDHAASNNPAEAADSGSWSPPAADQAVPGRRPLTSRGRSWLLLVVAVAMVLIYVMIWTMFADTHMRDRFVQMPSGEWSEPTIGQARYRVNRLIQTERLNNPGDPEDPEVAEAGTVFVVAEVEVVQLAVDDRFFCKTALVVAGPRQIEETSVYLDGTKLPTNCEADELKVGEPKRFLSIFTVPRQFADEIYGVGVQYSDYGAPYQVVRPPA